MTNVPAIPERADLAPVSPPPDLDSWRNVMGAIIELSKHIADTEFVPKGLRGNAPAAAAAMLYGREVGLPPMTALNSTHVIDGSPSLSAETMRAMVLAAGHEIEPVESTGAICTYRGRRRGSDQWHSVTWTIDMGRAAGLAGKQNWSKYPRRMLQARASSELCEILFPDVIAGFRAYEVLEDDAEDDGTRPAPPAVQTGTKVTRKRATKALPAPPPPPPPAEDRPVFDGPPLPGEPGYAGAETPAGEGSSLDSPSPAGPKPVATEPATGQEDPDGKGLGEDPNPSGPSNPEDSASRPGGREADEATGGDAPTPAEPADVPPVAPRDLLELTRAQSRMLMGQLGRLGIDMTDDGREDRLSVVSTLVGRGISTTNDLRRDEAKTLIDTLAKLKDAEALAELVDAVNDSRKP